MAEPKSRSKAHPRSVDHTEDGKFKPGNAPAGRGRPRGSRNKLGEQFLIDLQDVWAKKGKGIIEKVAREKPHELLKVIAGLLPRQLHVQMNQLAEYSDEQLAQLRMLLEARTGAGGQGDPKLIEARPVEAEVYEPGKTF